MPSPLFFDELMMMKPEDQRSFHFVSQRLLIRPFEVRDDVCLVKYLNNLNVSKWLARVPYPYDLKDAQSWLSDTLSGNGSEIAVAAICEKQNPLAVIGAVGASKGCSSNCDEIVAVLGYWLAEPFWRRGYMVEAVRPFIEWLFLTCDVTTVTAIAMKDNKGSISVLNRMGFCNVGDAVCGSRARSEEMPAYKFSLGRSEFLKTNLTS